ncbi:hypothetical protein QE152_g34927 [Popillia japonica]|uniref:Uncharacterized protein n=1 Tax=Popillia japonica TaxID=7064 RepID=A0AAW1IT92_POPJA
MHFVIAAINQTFHIPEFDVNICNQTNNSALVNLIENLEKKIEEIPEEYVEQPTNCEENNGIRRSKRTIRKPGHFLDYELDDDEY